jgi:diacylglycerol kinase family enzyme
MKKMFVVLNPVAGNSQLEILRKALRRRFADARQVYEIHETSAEDRLADVVRQALDRGFELLVAVGGDGTVSGVADGLAHADVPLGIIPLGTGNALARDLSITLDVEGALDLLIGEHTVKRIDALQTGGRFFVLNISVGISAQIMRDTKRDAKRRFGRMAYLWNVIERLFGLERHRFTLKVDGQEMNLRATKVLVLNGGAIGSPYLRWGTDVHLDDGRVEVYAFARDSCPTISAWPGTCCGDSGKTIPACAASAQSSALAFARIGPYRCRPMGRSSDKPRWK